MRKATAVQLAGQQIFQPKALAVQFEPNVIQGCRHFLYYFSVVKGQPHVLAEHVHQWRY